jgi:ABC-type multidrug transport system fused ATPase/permease subunit
MKISKEKESFLQDLAICFSTLSIKDKRRILIIAFVQISLSFLDLIGILLIGLIGLITVNGLQSEGPGGLAGKIFSYLQIDGFSLQLQVFLLGLLACTLLIVKTLVSVFFTRRILFFFAHKSVSLSREVLSKAFNNRAFIAGFTKQEFIWNTTSGLNVLNIGVLGQSVNLVSDVSLFVIMGSTLLFVNPLICGIAILLFTMIGLILSRISNKQAFSLGKRAYEDTVKCNQQIDETLNSYREYYVGNRLGNQVVEISKTRDQLTSTLANLGFIPYVSKYVFEAGLVLSTLTIGFVAFLTLDASEAASTLGVFVAAGSRIFPSLLRFQQNLTQIRSNLGSINPVLDLILELKDVKSIPDSSKRIVLDHSGFTPQIKISNLTFAYPGAIENVIENVDLEIPPGTFVAIVGTTGAGKSTLADLILGIYTPTSGKVLINQKEPATIFKEFPGAVAYLPQQVEINSGTIADYLLSGYECDEVALESVNSVIKKAQLTELVGSFSHGINENLFNEGVRLSGGEKQRLGLARAMVTNPKILILDESTSALDVITEGLIMKSLNLLRGETTILVIAHRLSTVESADIVVYMQKGKVLATGTFDEVRSAIPEFDAHAKKSGMT